MEQFMSGVFYWILGFAILYIVIRSAVSSSQATAELRKIRILLQMQYDNSNKSKQVSDDSKQYNEILNVPYNTCPACNAIVSEDDNNCPSCGISLIE